MLLFNLVYRMLETRPFIHWARQC